MYTRKQYLNSECNHAEYYNQFVSPAYIHRVLTRIGYNKLVNSKDKHFNDIPLKLWDNIATPFPADVAQKLRDAGDYPTLAGGVCIAKQAARKIVEHGVTLQQ